MLSVLRFEPRPLWNGDLDMLNQIREDLNAVIESADKE